MINIFIADDHPVVRAGLKQVINETSDLAVVGEASQGGEVIASVMESKPDVVILDLSMPGRDGIDILKQLVGLKPELPILILSVYPEEQYGIRVLKAGAAGYMNKNEAPDKLIEAIRRIAAGRKYISPVIAERLALDLDSGHRATGIETLSDRELQVLKMIAGGKTISEIADELMLSVKTISTYRSRILEKLNLRTNAEITHYAFQNNIIE